MAGICSQTFQVNIVVAAMCYILLQDTDPITVTTDPAGTPFTKTFMYATGSNPNPSHPSFGFTLTTSTLPTGVSIIDVTWGHERPDTHRSGLQTNTVSGKIVVDDMYVGDMENTVTFTVNLNTGI